MDGRHVKDISVLIVRLSDSLMSNLVSYHTSNSASVMYQILYTFNNTFNSHGTNSSLPREEMYASPGLRAEMRHPIVHAAKFQHSNTFRSQARK